MKKLYRLGLALAFAAGCSKGANLDELEKLKTEACACKDKACGDAVNKKLDEAIEKLAKGGEPDEATGAKLMSLMEEAGKCLAKLQ